MSMQFSCYDNEIFIIYLGFNMYLFDKGLNMQ